MKRTLLLFFMLSVATVSLADVAGSVASALGMTREEVQTCFNKANVTLEDLMQIDEISEDRLQTMDFDDSALKAGCFFACLYQKKAVIIGAPVSMDQIKEIINSDKGIEPNLLAKILQIHDTCANQVKSIINECKRILKYILCSSYCDILTEAKRMESGKLVLVRKISHSILKKQE